MVTLDPHDWQKTFCKMSASWHWNFPSPKPYILTSPHAALEQSLRAIWDAASQAAVLIWPQIKLNSQLWSCTSFLVNTTYLRIDSLTWFLYNAMKAGNLISASSASSKSPLYLWKFSVHILLKPSLKDFEHNFTSMQNECNCMIVWTFIGIAFLWDWNENWPFRSLWPLLSFFQICWHIQCSTFTELSFSTLNSSAGILSPPLALLIVMFPNSYLTSHSRMSGSKWVTTPLLTSRSLSPFLCSSSVYSCHLFLIFSASVRSIAFLSFIVLILAWNFTWYL